MLDLMIEFSHMPEVGVSYGVVKAANMLYMSAAFTNVVAGDLFKKERSRQIILGRISNIAANCDRYQEIQDGDATIFLSQNGKPRGICVESEKTPRQIVKAMRAIFKPDGETDLSHFETVIPVTHDLNINARMYRTPHERIDGGISVWDDLVEAFKDAVKA